MLLRQLHTLTEPPRTAAFTHKLLSIYLDARVHSPIYVCICVLLKIHCVWLVCSLSIYLHILFEGIFALSEKPPISLQCQMRIQLIDRFAHKVCDSSGKTLYIDVYVTFAQTETTHTHNVTFTHHPEFGGAVDACSSILSIHIPSLNLRSGKLVKQDLSFLGRSFCLYLDIIAGS